ncbi:MAG: hypothetical protein A3K09_02375 [Nitrospinae bacterium RIFCSPLOWO2_12_FULL_47_7]|nr:MAG: hypothetical protein A3K09_02375 [Nitrospinae bacterium RIFCSPLOWO2_12_FULL_47_7]
MRLGILHAHLKQYKDAADKFKQLMDDYPDNPERVKALLLLGDANYSGQEYQESKLNYQRFIELYPAHPEVAHAHYFKAMSDYKTIELKDRDQTATRNALDSFNVLIKSFPNSAWREKAIQKKNECIEKLAMNLFEVGKFYFRTGNYASAIKRMQSQLEQYPNRKFSDEVVFFLAESYYMEQNYEKARETYNQLLQQYPKSKFGQNARDRLKSIRK